VASAKHRLQRVDFKFQMADRRWQPLSVVDRGFGICTLKS
jgi:hypothetical protein